MGRRLPWRAALLELPGRARLSAAGGGDLAVWSRRSARSLAALPPPANSIPRSCAFIASLCSLVVAGRSLPRGAPCFHGTKHLPRHQALFLKPRLFAKFNYRIKWFDGWENHKLNLDNYNSGLAAPYNSWALLEKED